jgi:uncharacterized membrane protein
MTAPLRRDAKVVVGAFLVSGVVHLVKPEVYEPLMPRWVPAHREVILASGVAELAGAVGLLLPPTRRLAGLASAALLVAVFPGNVKMALDASGTRNTGFKAAAWARLPLQLPMIRGALRAGRA